jgi:hypothetical protein
MLHAVRIEPLTEADVAPAVELAVRVLRVGAGDRGEPNRVSSPDLIPARALALWFTALSGPQRARSEPRLRAGSA